MRPLDALTAVEARAIERVVFDLDDTVLDHGVLTERAYAALHRLREAGLELVASTGRPAGWAELIARQWPVAAALAENGAVAWSRTARGDLELSDPVDTATRAERRAKIGAIASELEARFDALVLADDNAARRTDATFDIGERRQVAPEIVARAREVAHGHGARTFVSSVHMHVTFEGHDKASGFAAWARGRGIDPARALRRSAFVGDSANDAAAFAAFGLTFGVANVRDHTGRLTVRPRFVAGRAMGAGFAEIAEAILRGRL